MVAINEICSMIMGYKSNAISILKALIWWQWTLIPTKIFSQAVFHVERGKGQTTHTILIQLDGIASDMFLFAFISFFFHQKVFLPEKFFYLKGYSLFKRLFFTQRIFFKKKPILFWKKSGKKPNKFFKINLFSKDLTHFHQIDAFFFRSKNHKWCVFVFQMNKSIDVHTLKWTRSVS